MNKLQLTAVLLPTEDASNIYSDYNGGIHCKTDKETVYLGSHSRHQHLYLTSTREIKEGDSIYSTLYGIGKIEKDYGGNDRPLIAKFINSEVRQSYHRSGKYDEKSKYSDVSAHNCKRIEFTTDPKLIADGVIAIPEKCLVSRDIHSAVYNGATKEVYFLEEFVKRYNSKDNQVDTDKRFNLEDMEDMADCVFDWMSSKEIDYRDLAQVVRDYVKSITPQKSELNIWCEMEEIQRLPHMRRGMELGMSDSEFKIKLNNGAPVIHFE